MKIYWKSSLFLLGIIVLTVICYKPGVQGGFLFDDFHNLDGLGTYGGVHDWKTLWAFVHTGVAGPLGRPLSLLSFLLDDNTWPSTASWFKITNIEIHILCGLLLCWASILILRLLNYEEKTVQWMAVFSSACWILHPLMVSTTLYVVQRMAQLSTLFILLGIVGYLYGREKIACRQRLAYTLMSFSVCIGTLLAALSKENGALLPMFIFCIEFCFASKSRFPSPCRLWRIVFIWVPSVAVIGYLATLIDFSAHPWPQRNFNQPERLMTESRILWDYARYIFLPTIEGHGLYQDGIRISTGILDPWTTFPAIVGVVAVALSGFLFRRRAPLLSFAILFYFVGQIIESSVVGLELYFEHRNYLSALFVFFPISSALTLLSKKTSKPVVVILAAGILCLLSVMTWKRSNLWANTEILQIYWAQSNPDSARAQNALGNYLVKNGRISEANKVLESAMKRMPDSALLNFALLLQKTYTKTARPVDFENTANRAIHQKFDAQAIVALRTLVDNANLSTSPVFYRESTLNLIEILDRNSSYSKLPLYMRLSSYLKAKIYLGLSDSEKSCFYYKKAALMYGNVNSILMMVAENANHGNFECASQLLNTSRIVLKNQSDIDLDRPRSDYEKDIKYIEVLVDKSLKMNSNHKNGRGDEIGR